MSEQTSATKLLHEHMGKSQSLQLKVMRGQITAPDTLLFCRIGQLPEMDVSAKAFLEKASLGTV